MKKISALFVLGIVQSAAGESLLSAQSFPKTFEDLSFSSRTEVLRQGYMPYAIEYDENGVCVKGCAYKGITIKEDMVAVDEANEEMANLIATQVTQPEPQPNNHLQPPRNDYAEPTESSEDEYVSPLPSVTPWAPPQNWCRNGLSYKLPLRYPIDMTDFRYRISSDFGFRKYKNSEGKIVQSFHPAIDISCPVGTPVYATADGVVEAAGWDPYGGGNYISIKHDNGLITLYMHLSKIEVSKGQSVSACDKIALSGNTGRSTGAHLDYRVRFQGEKNKYIDILCPCKASNKDTQQSYNTNTQSMTCEHSLFYNYYKFKPYNINSDDTKRSQWRVKHGHCMVNPNDLLPDEVR